MIFFRREPKKPTASNNARARSLQDVFAPIPVAEVSESTWNEWEDSVAFQNTHDDVAAPTSSESLDTAPKKPENPVTDPFASVTKNGN